MTPTCAVPTLRQTPAGWRIRLCLPAEAPMFLDATDAREIARRLELGATAADCPRQVATWCRLLRRLAVTVDRRNRGDA